jgi:hypothetical protein
MSLRETPSIRAMMEWLFTVNSFSVLRCQWQLCSVPLLNLGFSLALAFLLYGFNR